MLRLDVSSCQALVVSQRWLEKVTEDGDCVVWTAAKDFNGYGKVALDGRAVYVHRAAWVAAHGRDVPEGLTIDHLCRNRACVRPDHLEAVTHKVNVLRGETVPARRKAQTHCLRGHELAGDNVKISARGERICLACRLAKGRRKSALLAQARRAVGLSYREYVAQYGQSQEVARALIDAG